MNFRKATKNDVPFIVKMIASDTLGKLREDYKEPLPEKYFNAFKAINEDPNQELIVVETNTTEIIGTLQMSFIQYLTYQGGVRAQIEAVRIREDFRGKGVGKLVFDWAIERAKQRNAHLLQLTTDKKRPDAIKFYKKLGFVNSHEGMKFHL
ncbi:GNAT family N-acetyltransferase [Aureibaculum luteum]|uniref:GNAT family N-acetyltransferase n=1 Tax=Aureibaculum luteum TaxID=1548456 RepID=UPI000E554914|nr:GNAT family N-acetyltransferase [Aureibaculum luteum]